MWHETDASQSLARICDTAAGRACCVLGEHEVRALERLHPRVENCEL
jgi:hypothetical protein